jgi:hypothetical protein
MKVRSVISTVFYARDTYVISVMFLAFALESLAEGRGQRAEGRRMKDEG